MAGIDTDQEVDDYQASLTDLGGPDLVQFDGSDIQRLAPEIFDIIVSELGWTTQELLAWQRYVDDSPLGSCGGMDVSSSVAHLIADAWNMEDQRHNLHRIDLGLHHSFGELVADLGAIPYAYPTAQQRYKAISSLLPDWCELAGTGDFVRPTVEPNFDNRMQHTYRGMFYVNDMLEDHLRWAASTVVGTIDVIMSARIPTEYYVGGAPLVMEYPDGYCFYSPDVIESYLREKRIVLHDRWCEAGCAEPVVQMSLSETGIPQIERHLPNDDCRASMNHPSDDLSINVCGPVIGDALRTDYYWYWATRLHHAATLCDDPWTMLLAAIAARAGLAEVLKTASTFVHEIGHHNGIGHCRYACCQGSVAAFWYHSMLARFGCARSAGDMNAGQYPSRYERERWSSRVGGSKGCDPDIYLAEGVHCSLFRQHRSWRYRIEYDTRWRAPSLDVPDTSLEAGARPFDDWPKNEVPRDTCVPGTFGYPFVASIVTLADGGESCF